MIVTAVVVALAVILLILFLGPIGDEHRREAHERRYRDQGY